jgi:hypothetical protein
MIPEQLVFYQGIYSSVEGKCRNFEAQTSGQQLVINIEG